MRDLFTPPAEVSHLLLSVFPSLFITVFAAACIFFLGNSDDNHERLRNKKQRNDEKPLLAEYKLLLEVTTLNVVHSKTISQSF